MKQLKSVTVVVATVSLIVLVLTSMSDILTENRTCSIILKRAQVLYIGVDNPVEIVINGVDPANVWPSIQGGTMRNDTIPGHFIVNVTAGSKSFITVKSKESGTLVDCRTFEFRIKKIQDPVTFINDIRNDGVILKENLQTINGVFTRMVDCDYDGRFVPQSFSMSVIENGEWKEYAATGPELTPDMKTALTKCDEEDKIIFHNVMTKGSPGDVRHVNSVTITVK